MSLDGPVPWPASPEPDAVPLQAHLQPNEMIEWQDSDSIGLHVFIKWNIPLSTCHSSRQVFVVAESSNGYLDDVAFQVYQVQKLYVIIKSYEMSIGTLLLFKRWLRNRSRVEMERDGESACVGVQLVLFHKDSELTSPWNNLPLDRCLFLSVFQAYLLMKFCLGLNFEQRIGCFPPHVTNSPKQSESNISKFSYCKLNSIKLYVRMYLYIYNTQYAQSGKRTTRCWCVNHVVRAILHHSFYPVGYFCERNWGSNHVSSF